MKTDEELKEIEELKEEFTHKENILFDERKKTSADFQNRIKRLKEEINDVFFGCDDMTGFQGEIINRIDAIFPEFKDGKQEEKE